MKIDSTVGRRIRRARLKANIGQSKLAERVLWALSFDADAVFTTKDVSEIENGKRYPFLLECAMIAEILQVSMDYICFGRLQSTLAKRISRLSTDKVKIIETIIDALTVHKQIITLAGG